MWYVDPDRKTITVYRPQHDPVALNESDHLSGYDVLPGFECPVAEIFRRYWLTES